MNQRGLKLYYFDMRARGEFLRLMMAQAGITYEDRRVEMQEWPQLKQGKSLKVTTTSARNTTRTRWS